MSSAAPANIASGDSLPIRFQWARDGIPVRDESVSVRIRNARTGALITGYTYGGFITINDSSGEYLQNFKPAQYGVQPGTQLKIMIYFGGKLKATVLVNVN